MKRILVALLCIVLCLGLFGCGNNTEEKNAEAHAALEKVINKESSFWMISRDAKTNAEMSFENCRYTIQGSMYVTFRPTSYLFCDFDRDGIDEMLVADLELSHFLFLKYNAGVVRAYDYMNIPMQNVSADGSFITVLGYPGYENRRAISRVSFTDDVMTVTHSAYMDVETDEYTLNGKDVDKETVKEYIDDWCESTEKAAWTSLYKDPFLSAD